MQISVVVGNPKPRSRTWDAAHRVASALGGADATVTSYDLTDLGPGLLGWGDEAVASAVATVAASDLVVVASPTFKATYTGLLKLFLDQLETGTGLEGVVAVPMQLGAAPHHHLSPELHLKPVLVEVGAIIPAPALYLLEKEVSGPTETAWIERWAPVVRAATSVRA